MHRITDQRNVRQLLSVDNQPSHQRGHPLSQCHHRAIGLRQLSPSPNPIRWRNEMNEQQQANYILFNELYDLKSLANRMHREMDRGITRNLKRDTETMRRVL